MTCRMNRVTIFVSSDIICRHGHTNHGYAGDTQLYCAFRQQHHSTSLSSLAQCVQSIRGWMKVNWLKLSDEKTELMVFSIKLSQIKQMEVSVRIGDVEVVVSEKVRNLGVIEDQTLSLQTG